MRFIQAHDARTRFHGERLQLPESSPSISLPLFLSLSFLFPPRSPGSLERYHPRDNRFTIFKLNLFDGKKREAVFHSWNQWNWFRAGSRREPVSRPFAVVDRSYWFSREFVMFRHHPDLVRLRVDEIHRSLLSLSTFCKQLASSTSETFIIPRLIFHTLHLKSDRALETRISV